MLVLLCCSLSLSLSRCSLSLSRDNRGDGWGALEQEGKLKQDGEGDMILTLLLVPQVLFSVSASTQLLPPSLLLLPAPRIFCSHSAACSVPKYTLTTKSEREGANCELEERKGKLRRGRNVSPPSGFSSELLWPLCCECVPLCAVALLSE